MPESSLRVVGRAVVLAVTASLLLAGCTAAPVTDEAVESASPEPDISVTVGPKTPEPVATPTPFPEPSAPAPPSPAPEPTPEPSDPPTPTPRTPAPVPAPSPSPDAGLSTPDAFPGRVPAPGTDRAKTHDDRVEVISEIGPLSFAYTEAQGVDFTFNDSGWDSASETLTLNVTGEHDGADSVANWFNARTLGYAVHTDIDTNDEPDELHYAFCGDLGFSDFGAQIETCFGQGDSDTLTNNWWMGGSSYDDERPECYIDENATDANATSLVACLENHGSSSYTFEVNAGGTSANLFSFYSPSQIGTLTGSRLQKFVSSHPDLDAKTKAFLNALAAELGKTPIEVPSAWTVSCGSACTHSITEGQLWAGVHDTTAYESAVWKKYLSGTSLNNDSINVTAGRDSSSDVADWFIDQVGSGGMVGAGVNDGTSAPGDLHFAFCGDLSPEGGTETSPLPLCVGQGENHDDGDANNWWIGGSGWQAASLDSSTSAEVLTLLTPTEDHGIIRDLLSKLDVRMLFSRDGATAIFVLSGTPATGAFVDGMAVVVGIG